LTLMPQFQINLIEPVQTNLDVGIRNRRAEQHSGCFQGAALVFRRMAA